MVELSAKVYRINASTAGAVEWVDAIAVALASSTQWTLVSGLPSGYVIATNNTDGSQVMFEGTTYLTTQGRLKIGYSPSGTLVDETSVPESGLLNITATTAGITGAEAQFYLAEYPDALLVVVKNSSRKWLWAGFAGSIITPLSESDYAYGFNNAVLVGRPTDLLATPGWLYASPTFPESSVVQTPNGWSKIATSNRIASTSSTLSNVDGIERFVPYLSSVFGGGILGATKYIRQWRTTFADETVLASVTVGSDQAWKAYDTLATGDFANQIVLWSKSETVV